MHIYLRMKPTALVAKYVVNPYFGLTTYECAESILNTCNWFKNN